jgi:crotonobetaine/carnitine-CoA ligase
MTIGGLLEVAVSKAPGKTYLYFEDQEVSYQSFNAQVNRAAHGFLHLGVRKGDKVCLMLPNCPEFLYAWLGLAKIGGIMVPINTAFKSEEACYILQHSEAKALVVAQPFCEMIDGIRGGCGQLEEVVCLGPKALPKAITFQEMMEAGPATRPEVTVLPQDLASIMYTSGTTGYPKGVMHTQETYVMTGQGFALWTGATKEDRFMACLPLFHANSQVYHTMGSLAIGASLILVERFSASRFWDQVRRYGATHVTCLAAMLHIFMKQPRTEQDRDNPLRVVFGGPVTEEMYQELEGRFGFTILEGFGLTECFFGTINPIQGQRKIGSVGLPRWHPRPGFRNEVRVVDEEDREVPRGVVGEIVLRNPCLMKGYYKEPEKTAEVLKGGWLHTGDNGRMDEEGYLYFVDRKKDMVRRRGENISSLEVEMVINRHPKVLESAVIGVPSELGEEEVKAYVVPEPGQSLLPQEIVEWCRERLAYFKVPRFIAFRDTLPKTPTQRVQKYLLRQEAQEGCFDALKVSL